MCDMMTEIDKERSLCEAQIENKTSGMLFLFLYLTCLFLPFIHSKRA